MAIEVSNVRVGILSWIGGLALTCKNGKKVGGNLSVGFIAALYRDPYSLIG